MEDLILGIEFGSTRIKAVLIDENNKVKFQNSYDWENRLEGGYWSYSKEEILNGLKACYKGLKVKFEKETNSKLTHIKSIGISAMMHGFIALDKDDDFLTPFRTWRNTKQKQASEILSDLFKFNIPERWSIAHFYQTILNKEKYVKNIKKITTLSGYIHYLLTGEFVLGLNDASGMFPISIKTKNYNEEYVDKFNKLLEKEKVDLNIKDLLPKVLEAGLCGGKLTEEGLNLIDDSKELQIGIPFCPPEGDAGTGMVATNSIREKTGNISAGTSVFAMVVLNKRLKEYHKELDIVVTPDGTEVAMVHCNNCTAELDNWINIFKENLKVFGVSKTDDEVYGTLYKSALNADDDCGNVLSCNYLSGEHITDFASGNPLYLRQANSKMNLPNFMKSLLNSSVATLSIGFDILDKEGISVDKMYGHGGLFKIVEVGPKIVSSALNVPICITTEAGEGGPYGIALLSKYMFYKNDMSLSDFLDKCVYKDKEEVSITASKEDVNNYKKYLEKYKKMLNVERTATEYFD